MDKAQLRQKVREVLAIIPAKRICTLDMLIEGVKRLTQLAPFDEEEKIREEIKDAIEWNQEKGLLDFRFDNEAEVDSYHLTERGRTREGLA